MRSDLHLLRQFARENSQDAFAALVQRHLNLVYSAALRQVRSPQLVEEIAQSVFADLARNAGKLKSDTILTAWLYAITRRTAIDAVRKESHRRLREQIAVEMNNMNATANEWTQIEPLLDDAMAALDETDRSAILLRYFENKSLREVGEALGASEDAAQKRVSRAVERLREFFSKRNVAIGASGLAVLISANAVQSAPVGLAALISTSAVLAGTAVQTSTVITATKTIAMTTLQKRPSSPLPLPSLPEEASTRPTKPRNCANKIKRFSNSKRLWPNKTASYNVSATMRRISWQGYWLKTRNFNPARMKPSF